MCKSIGLACIERVEYATRYLLTFKQTGSGDITTMVTSVESQLVASLHDRMTQCRYHSQIKSFDLDINPAPVYEVDILTHGKSALEKANTDLGKCLFSYLQLLHLQVVSDNILKNTLVFFM